MPDDLRAVLADPRFLPHRIDHARDEIAFFPTSAALLARPSFIDGRSDFAAGSEVAFPRHAVLEAAAELTRPAGPDRMIFHVSFCGSTLLSRMLEVPGAAFLLKEPNLLVDLADWARRVGRVGDPRLAATLDWARAALRRRWRASEPVVVKPSNWANNLLPALTDDPASIRPLFVTMERRAFLIAVLRGGRDRLAFTAHAAQHLSGGPGGESLLREAIGATADPIGRAIHLAAVALHQEMRLFGAAIRRGGWHHCVLDADEVTGRPVEAALVANAILDLGIPTAQLAGHATIKARENAKSPGRSFMLSTQDVENDEIERHHGARIDAALDWAERALGPHPALGVAGDARMPAAG